MKKYSVEELRKELGEFSMKEENRYVKSDMLFLANKIVELTNRIQELESKGKIDE